MEKFLAYASAAFTVTVSCLIAAMMGRFAVELAPHIVNFLAK